MAYLYRRKNSKYWWIGWSTGGREYQSSTKEEEEGKAQKKLAEYEMIERAGASGRLTEKFVAALAAEHAVKPKRPLREAVEGWLADMRMSVKKGSAVRYEGVLQEFLGWIGDGFLEDVSGSNVQGWLRVKAAKVSGSTLRYYRKILGAFFRALNYGDVMKDVRLPRVVGGQRQAFSVEEVGKLWRACGDDFWRYMVVLGFYTGLRMGDLILLEAGRVDLRQRVLRVRTQKRDRWVQVPMAPAVVEALRGIPGRGYLWPEQAALYLKRGPSPFSNEFREVMAAAGLVEAPLHWRKQKKLKRKTGPRQVSPLSFHSLRHSFVTTIKATGAHQAVAKELAGHSSDLVNDLYTHLPVSVLEEAVARLPKIS